MGASMVKSGIAFFIAVMGFVMQANPAWAEGAAHDWKAEVEQADSAYWNAYNRADPVALNAFLTDDVEFYHDRGGFVLGKKALSAINDGMTNAKSHLRREAVPGTVHVFLMRKANEVYGAIVSGEHQFYITRKDQPEVLAGRAYFTQLMLLKDREWRVSRIFSYEHVNAAVPAK